MGLFDRFRKPSDKPQAVTPANPSTLPFLCYGIAYFVLPHYAFNDCDKLVELFQNTPTAAGPFYYLMGCSMRKIEPNHDDAQRFRAHHGDLNGTHDYFILEYPTPPPVDFSGVDILKLPPEQMPVLAPYLSAIIRHRETKATSYYTLGQAPLGGTTFRSVTPDGTNCNLGPGPEPGLDAFLKRLREKE